MTSKTTVESLTFNAFLPAIGVFSHHFRQKLSDLLSALKEHSSTQAALLSLVHYTITTDYQAVKP